jgi:transposase InsO family protein
MCIDCQRKRVRPMTKGVVVRPILSKEFSARGQVDPIDMQSLPHGSFKWIMVYQNHLTKWPRAENSLDKIGGTITPFVIGRTRVRWQSRHIDLNSSIESRIMVYQNHLTKFVVIRPLTPKRAAEVAYQLMDIFLLFGAPHILQSDNGSEFTERRAL